MLNKETKTNLIKEYAVHEGDTGSPEVQIAILSKRISELTEHLKKNPKDNHSRRGMQQMIGKRRKFLNYLLKNDIERYRSVIEDSVSESNSVSSKNKLRMTPRIFL